MGHWGSGGKRDRGIVGCLRTWCCGLFSWTGALLIYIERRAGAPISHVEHVGFARRLAIKVSRYQTTEFGSVDSGSREDLLRCI